jgi:hypothetical protein
MQQLFMVYLGGSAPSANLELHDVQFVIAPRIEDTYQQLIGNWFGNKKGLHLDAYKAIVGADGYAISLHDTPPEQDLRLYFVNVGGYHKDNLAELHEFGLFVAPNPTAAKIKAKQSLLQNATKRHKDNLVDVDNCIELSLLEKHYIHLTESTDAFDLTPDWFGYRVIG